MSLAAVEHAVVLVATVAVVLVVAATVTTAVVVVRRWRRRARSLMARFNRGWLARAAPAHGAQVAAAARSTVASPGWWVLQRDRQLMWRAVTRADRAVTAAKRSQAPVGELPMLARRLRTAATRVDAMLLAAGGERRLQAQASAERSRVEAAAADIQRAAVESVADVVSSDVHPLMTAVAVEVAALSAGVQAARVARAR